MQQHILLVEDDPADACLLQERFLSAQHHDYTLTHIESLDSLDDTERFGHYDAVLLDLGLPGISGFDAVRFVQKRNHELPIIVLTGTDDDSMAKHVVNMGVQDYLVKGRSNDDTILRAIDYSIQRKRYEQKILHLTRHDRLTNLVNGDVFNRVCTHRMQHVQNTRTTYTLYAIGINHFQCIIDLHGQDIANTVLIELSGRLMMHATHKEYVTRSKDANFLLFTVSSQGDGGDVERVEALIEYLSRPIVIGNKTIQPNMSIGVARKTEEVSSAALLMHQAQAALEDAFLKQSSMYVFYSDVLRKRLALQNQIISSLDAEMEAGNFFLTYHPKIDLKTKRVRGAEALLRWNHSECGFISPEIFIPIIEKMGNIESVTEWVLQKACAEYAHPAMYGQLDVAVNISARQLNDHNIVGAVERALKKTRMSPKHLVLELTETAMIKDAHTALEVMVALKKLGVSIHIDDFGTSHSSLEYLRYMPIDALKIDRCFVQHMLEREEDTKLVNAMIRITHEFGMQVVAEGVENDAHASRLQQMQCNTAQGFLYTKPLVLEEFAEWKRSYNAALH